MRERERKEEREKGEGRLWKQIHELNIGLVLSGILRVELQERAMSKTKEKVLIFKKRIQG